MIDRANECGPEGGLSWRQLPDGNDYYIIEIDRQVEGSRQGEAAGAGRHSNLRRSLQLFIKKIPFNSN